MNMTPRRSGLKSGNSPRKIKETSMGSKPTSRGTRANRRDAVDVEIKDPRDANDAIARTLTRPETQAATTMQVWEPNHEVNALARELTGQIAAGNRGDLSRAEGMLLAQAHTLDAIFNSLARRARGN